MADPVIHDLPTNPCQQCHAGERVVMEKSWADPHCWVICACGNSAGANTIPEAISVWTAANPVTPVAEGAPNADRPV
jgi:hypothetical protein